ncbi:hypothetical protein [Undibacterium sp. SXout20W]|uniref:hypothetical protein n=1 Tax=Undibacterium sp. SXout20W TaxID=3413051 RepID=UPI003BF10286
MKFLKFIFNGVMEIADASVDTRSYQYPRSGGFARDRARLAGDVSRVGKDLRKVINSKYGSQQSHKCSSSK